MSPQHVEVSAFDYARSKFTDEAPTQWSKSQQAVRDQNRSEATWCTKKVETKEAWKDGYGNERKAIVTGSLPNSSLLEPESLKPVAHSRKSAPKPVAPSTSDYAESPYTSPSLAPSAPPSTRTSSSSKGTIRVAKHDMGMHYTTKLDGSKPSVNSSNYDGALHSPYQPEPVYTGMPTGYSGAPGSAGPAYLLVAEPKVVVASKGTTRAYDQKQILRCRK